VNESTDSVADEKKISTKVIESTDSFADAKSSNKKVVWNEDDREKWLGAVPKVRKKKRSLYGGRMTVPVPKYY